MKTIHHLLLSAVLISLLSSSLRADETPSWKFELEENPYVGLQNVQWHTKDYGWLMTARLTTPRKIQLNLISHLKFEGLNEAEEVIWEYEKIIRRKDFDENIGGASEIFLRVLLKEVPESVTLLKAKYASGKEEGETEE